VAAPLLRAQPRTAYGMLHVRSGVGRRVTERCETKVIRLHRWVQIFFLLQERSKHPREMVVTPKASTSSLVKAALALIHPLEVDLVVMVAV